MNPEQIQLTYQSIADPGIRLLIWLLVSACVALAGANVYQYFDRKALVRELMAVNNDLTRSFTVVSATLEHLQGQLEDMRIQLLNRLLKS